MAALLPPCCLSALVLAMIASSYLHLSEMKETRWTARIGLGERTVITKTLRRRAFALVARITRSARRLTLHLPRRWPWKTQFSRALARL